MVDVPARFEPSSKVKVCSSAVNTAIAPLHWSWHSIGSMRFCNGIEWAIIGNPELGGSNVAGAMANPLVGLARPCSVLTQSIITQIITPSRW